MGFSSMLIMFSPNRPARASRVSPSRPSMTSFTFRHEGSLQLDMSWNFPLNGWNTKRTYL